MTGDEPKIPGTPYCTTETMNYCAQPADKCAPGVAKCSRYFGIDDDSLKCQAWITANQTGKNMIIYDQVAKRYCGNHPDAPECQCVNRADDPTYKAISNLYQDKDSCWWAPCKNTNKYWVTSDLRNQDCPTNVCQVIYDAVQDHNVKITGNTSNVTCPLPGGSTGGGGHTGGSDGSITISAATKKIIIIVAASLGGVFVLILLIMLIRKLFRKKKAVMDFK
jgi:hypothetical protein